MGSAPTGWRSAAGYDYIETLSASDLAWEWLRRNDRYARDYAACEAVGPDRQVLRERMRRDWGVRFRRRSRAACAESLGHLGAARRYQHRAAGAVPQLAGR